MVVDCNNGIGCEKHVNIAPPILDKKATCPPGQLTPPSTLQLLSHVTTGPMTLYGTWHSITQSVAGKSSIMLI